MKKILAILLATLLFSTIVFATESTTPKYNSNKVDKNLMCASGNYTKSSVDILVVDEVSDYAILVVDGFSDKFIKINENDWGLVTLQGVEKGKEYKYYVVSFRNGERYYSEIESFILE